MFRGISNLTVDAKGRLAMPKHHRDRLEADGVNTLIVTADPALCLLIFSMPDWLVIEAKIASLPIMDKLSRTYQRLYLGYATETGFDSNGRILLPTQLRKYAGIDRKAVLIGQGKKCELWSEAAFENESANWSNEINETEFSMLPEAIAKLTI